MYNKMMEYMDKLEEILESYQEEQKKRAQVQQEMQKLKALKDTVYGKYHHKYGSIAVVEAKRYSPRELEAIKAELLDNSILTIIKRFLGIGKKQSEIYADLMGKMNGLYTVLQEELIEINNQEQRLEADMKSCGKRIERKYTKILEQTGSGSDADLEKYALSEIDSILHLGDTGVLLEAEIGECEDILKKTMPSAYEGEGSVLIPYTKNINSPFHFCFEYIDEVSHQTANSLTRSLLYQLIRQIKDYEIEIHLMDGENTGSDFAELMRLKDIRENDVWELNKKATKGQYKYVQTYLSDHEITEGLREFDDYLVRVADELAGFKDIGEYNEEQEKKENSKGRIPLQLLVVQNFPTGFNESDIQLLKKLIKNGKERGISVILQYDRKNRAKISKYLSEELNKNLNMILLEQNKYSVMEEERSGGIYLRTMPEGKTEYIQSIIDERTKEVVVDNRFQALFDTTGPFGQMDATDGICIPFSIDRKGNIREYELGNAMNAHGLISGGTGSGKSTLLHMLISSVVKNYSPDDVEIWLSDYKLTEFQTYKNNTPPHIKFIGLSTNKDFSYALLDKISEEQKRRQQMITEAGEELKNKGEKTSITNITSYRKYYGKNSMKRLLIIIDEFHVMSQHANAEPEYKLKLENILSEARAMGITLVFSDQSVIEGLNGLSEKGKKQMRARLAMANEKDELRAMLQTQDMEEIGKLSTMKVGDCAMITTEEYRDENGEVKEKQVIERVKNIYIDGETRYILCENIRKYYHAESYIPDYIDESEITQYDNEMISKWQQKQEKQIDFSRETPIYLGDAMDLSGCFMIPLQNKKGNNLIFVGGTELMQSRILFSVISSFMRLDEYEIKIFADSYSELFRECETRLYDLVDDYENICLYDDLEDICREINILLGKVANRERDKKILVIWLGLEDIYDELKDYDEEKPEKYERLSVKKKKEQKKKQEQSEKIKDDIGNSLMSSFASLFGEEMMATVETEQEEEENDYEDEDEDEIYNAMQDIKKLTEDGPKWGIYNFILYDVVHPVRDIKEVKMDNFKHKLAFALGRDDCGDYLGRSNLLDDMREDSNIIAYYDGKNLKKFVPYKFEEK